MGQVVLTPGPALASAAVVEVTVRGPRERALGAALAGDWLAAPVHAEDEARLYLLLRACHEITESVSGPLGRTPALKSAE